MTRDEAICLLRQLAQRLGRLPTRRDLPDAQVVQVKAALGPWPRALEAAGLKEPKPDTRHARTVEQRRRRKIAARPQKPQAKEREVLK